MKRALFLISSLDYGGAQRAVSNIVCGLADEYSVDLLLNDDSHIVYPYKGNVISLGINRVDDRTRLGYQVTVFLKRIKKLKELKRDGGYQTVVSFLDSANIANIITGGRQCRVVISVRNVLSAADKWKNKLIVSPLVKRYYNKADIIVATSEDVKEDLINCYHIRREIIQTIPNGIDIRYIKNMMKKPAPLDVDAEYTNYVSIGRLTKQKGQWHIIRAFAEVYRINNKIRLYILGEGELRPYLESLIREYNLESSVILCGFIDNPYTILNRMDIFVFASLHEGFSNAIIEAMACGLPCISSDHRGGAREILFDADHGAKRIENYIFADYGIMTVGMTKTEYTGKDSLDKGEEALKEAMQLMLEDKSVRKQYAELSVARAMYFSIEEACKKWGNII